MYSVEEREIVNRRLALKHAIRKSGYIIPEEIRCNLDELEKLADKHNIKID